MTSPEILVAVPPRARSIESALRNRWARILIPSLSDLFFLSILVWLFLAGASGWKGLLVDGDVGWHIRTGEYILHHHAVPRYDLYSFSKPEAPWYAWEWLTDVIDASLYGLAGLKGIVLSAGVIIAAFATTLLRRMIWRGASPLIAMVVALVGVGASSIHFLARPHIFTLLLLSISMWMIEADRQHPSRRIWWLVPLTMVWTNLHGGFLALIAVLGVAAVGTAVEACVRRPCGGSETWSKPAHYALLTGACAAASLVNPYGYGLHVHIAEYLRSDWIRNAIQEFQSPSFHSENIMQFEALLLAGLLVAGSLFRRGRIVEALWIVVFAHMSLGSVRHVPIYVTVAAPIIACEIGRWWESWTRSGHKETGGARKGSLSAIVNQISADSAAAFRRSSAWPAMAVVALIFIRQPIQWPQDFPDEVFPVKMVHAHAAEILSSRVLTTDQWADYLIFTNPRQKVFVDGRSDFYGPEIGNQYLRIVNGQWDWRQLMAKYNFNLALLQTDLPISQLLKSSAGWTVVEDDGKRILLRRAASAPPARNRGPEPRS